VELETVFEYEVSFHIIDYHYGLFFYKACYNVNFKSEKLLHRKSKNFDTTWMKIKLGW